MPSKRSFMIEGRLVPEQEISEMSDEMVRLAAAKDAEIAALKKRIRQLDAAANYREPWPRMTEKERQQLMPSLRAEIAALTEQRDRWKADCEDTRDCLNNERRIWMRINAGCATFAAERDEARAQIASLTEQRDRAMKVVAAAQAWAVDRHAAMTSAFYPSEIRLFNAVVGFNSLDAEAKAETEGT